MILRDLRATDVADVHALNEGGTPGVATATPDHLAWLLERATIALGAEIDGRLAAFCLVLPPGTAYESVNYRWFGERYRDFVYLDRVAVAARHRGGGLGSALYREVERRATAAWFTLEVNLRPRNDGSLRFHARHGFAEVGQLETDYGCLVSLMAKRLR
ncbi:MAG TPA: GNAT family N-acetyltransferase [Minicystis sp.]|nr:GNAT family N-acetyltransferase [Minicystis sp.]